LVSYRELIYKKAEALSTSHVAKNSRDVAFWGILTYLFINRRGRCGRRVIFEVKTFIFFYLCDLSGEELGVGIIFLSYIQKAASQTASENMRQNRTDY